MAMFLFIKAMLEDRPIDVFNGGDMQRDFTYIDDIVEGLVRVVDTPAASDPTWDGMDPDPGTSRAPYRVYNIGNSDPVELMTVIGLLERELVLEARKNLLPMQPGDVPATYADVSDLARDLGFSPRTSIEEGIKRFVAWYREFYAPAMHQTT
jgi:UDP-glucuronate 4-epimerase